MIRTLLDTSVAISLRDGEPASLERASVVDPVALLSILSVVELEGGVPSATEGCTRRRHALDELYETLDIIDFGKPEAIAYRQIVDALGFSRRKIVDRMIAAQAISAGATLATLNPRDFRRIPGLQIEDWTA